MSERERWIVYPLLILGLGTSLKDKLVAPSVVRAERIECDVMQCRQQLVASQLAARQVMVVDDQQQPRVLLRTIVGREGERIQRDKTRGQISLLDETNQVMCSLGQSIVCTQLVSVGPVEILGSRLRLYDREGKLKAQIRSSEVGKLQKADAGDPQTGATTGRLELFGSGPSSIVTMGSLEEGGFLAVTHGQHREHVMLNHNRMGSGLFAVDANGVARPLELVNPPDGREGGREVEPEEERLLEE